jgi:cytochrome c biogenesis protein CcdA
VTPVLIGFVGGIITGLSPCVLPVLPVVFLGGGSAGQDAEGPDAKLARRRSYLVVAGLTASFGSSSASLSARSSCRARDRCSPPSRWPARPATSACTVGLTLGFAAGTAIPLLAFVLPRATGIPDTTPDDPAQTQET